MALDQIWKQQLTLVTYGNEYLTQDLSFNRWIQHSIFNQHQFAFSGSDVTTSAGPAFPDLAGRPEKTKVCVALACIALIYWLMKKIRMPMSSYYHWRILLSVMAPKPKLPGSLARNCLNGTAQTMITKHLNHSNPLYAMKHSGVMS